MKLHARIASKVGSNGNKSQLAPSALDVLLRDIVLTQVLLNSFAYKMASTAERPLGCRDAHTGKYVGLTLGQTFTNTELRNLLLSKVPPTHSEIRI